jgi:predicted dehydrogenase
MSTKLNWGILGTGSIAHTFAQQLPRSETGALVAVGSRTSESAQRFGAEFGVVRCHGSYEALLDDPSVQAVYISTPHPMHLEWAVRAARAKKHILCEKPIGLNEAEARQIIDAARRHDVFLMEAFMYRCHPQTRALNDLLRQRAIGEVRLIQASFGFNGPDDPHGRLLAPELGGGGILDVGCYPVSIARLIAGVTTGGNFAEPLELEAVGHLGSTGVDEWAVAVARFPGDILAQLSTSVRLDQENAVRIFGTRGCVFIPQPWAPARDGGRWSFTVHRHGQSPQEVSGDEHRPLYAIETDVVAENIARREAPHPAMTWDDTLGNLLALDKWRRAIGLTYPAECAARQP